eukprot:7334150-Pyramimonas_sp.AAC.1
MTEAGAQRQIIGATPRRVHLQINWKEAATGQPAGGGEPKPCRKRADPKVAERVPAEEGNRD